MKKYLRYGLYSVGYTFLFCVLPRLIWLGVDGDKAERLFIYYLVIIFLTLGYVLFSVVLKDNTAREEKRFASKLEDIEIQNAAIAFSLSELKKELRGGKDKFGQ